MFDQCIPSRRIIPIHPPTNSVKKVFIFLYNCQQWMSSSFYSANLLLIYTVLSDRLFSLSLIPTPSCREGLWSVSGKQSPLSVWNLKRQAFCWAVRAFRGQCLEESVHVYRFPSTFLLPLERRWCSFLLHGDLGGTRWTQQEGHALLPFVATSPSCVPQWCLISCAHALPPPTCHVLCFVFVVFA